MENKTKEKYKFSGTVKRILSIDDVEVGMALVRDNRGLYNEYVMVKSKEKNFLTGGRNVYNVETIIFTRGGYTKDEDTLNVNSFINAGRSGGDYYSVDPDIVLKMKKAISLCNASITAVRSNVERNIKNMPLDDGRDKKEGYEVDLDTFFTDYA